MTNAAINVLYDISPLGFAHENPSNKTGIARVVEELAYQLAERPDCHLKLCSSEHLLGALDYAVSEPRLQTAEFPHNAVTAILLRKQKRTQAALDGALAEKRQIAIFTAKAGRKIINSLANAKNTSETLDSGSLRNADIYHSTFSPLTEQVWRAAGPQRFLTIYDMIPALFPQYCIAEMGGWFQTILSSIKEDAWILCISEATKVDLCEHIAIDPARVFVTPLAADPALFYPVTDAQELARVQHKYHVKPAPYVLSLCTIEPRKNIDHAIRCYVRLMQEGKTPDLQLVLAGSKGWNYDHIFRQIEGAEAFQANIVVTGFVANEDLAALYSGALAFVFPSLYEGFGLPPLEAMQCGVPVIVSNTSSLPEVVGEAGIMLDPKDADGLCQSLLSLYEDSSLRAELAKKSLLQAAGFSWQRCAEDTVNAYKTALGR